MQAKTILLCTLALAALPVTLSAGTVLEMRITFHLPGQAAKTTRARYDLQAGNVRLEDGAGRPTLIFRGDLDALFVFDHATSSYLVMDRETLLARRANVKEGDRGRRDTAAEQRPGADGEPRRAAGDDTARGGGPASSLAAWRKLEAGILVNGWRCDHYERTLAPDQRLELWMAGPDQLQLEPADLAGIGAMRRLGGSGPLPETNLAFFFHTHGDSGAPAGAPVRSRETRGSEVVSDFELTAATRRDLPPATFEVPPGYHRKQLKGGS